MAHTPGPWVVREPEDGELLEVHAERGGELICFPVWTPNERANISLIAAAPELLAALKEAYDALDYAQAQVDSDADRMHITRCRRKIKPVIDKAEGRSE